MRRRWVPTTVRWRLTLLYGGLFLVSGAALLAVTYVLVAHAPIGGGGGAIGAVRGPGLKGFCAKTHVCQTAPIQAFPAGRADLRTTPPSTNFITAPPVLRRLLKTPGGQVAVSIVGFNQRSYDLHSLIIESGIALAIMAVLSALLGWIVAGRVLRPLREMTSTTREISAASLDRRLALRGPRDELRELAETIDELLARLEGAFDSQRRFVANASHELRTPLSTVRVLLEMVMSDPHATVAGFREACAQVLEESEHQEALIDALLALALGRRGVERRERIDLAALAGEVAESRAAEAAARGVTVVTHLEPVTVAGDRRLLERLVANLVDNAIVHNHDGGEVEVAVAGSEPGGASLRIDNTGDDVPAAEIARLLQPFQRLTAERLGSAAGHGLGLSIVAAVADAHDAELRLTPRTGGGLEVDVRFPAAVGERVAEPAVPLPVG